MGVEECAAAAVNAQAFPDAITEYEAAVEDGNLRLIPGQMLAVDVDQDVAVTRVLAILVGSFPRHTGWCRGFRLC